MGKVRARVGIDGIGYNLIESLILCLVSELFENAKTYPSFYKVKNLDTEKLHYAINKVVRSGVEYEDVCDAVTRLIDKDVLYIKSGAYYFRSGSVLLARFELRERGKKKV